MTITDGAAILRAVCDEPADDLPRLAYADWLEETGGPHELARAGFVRTQIERASLQDLSGVDRMADMARSNELQRRARAVTSLCARETEWVRHYVWRVLRDELPPLLWQEFDRWELSGDGSNPVVVSRRSDDLSLTFRRGFVSAVRCTQGDWLRYGPGLVRRQPVEKVTLADRRPRRSAMLEKEPFDYWRSGHPHEPADFDLDGRLWEALFEVINGRPVVDGVDTSLWWLARETEGEIQADLSRACLLWAKRGDT